MKSLLNFYLQGLFFSFCMVSLMGCQAQQEPSLTAFWNSYKAGKYLEKKNEESAKALFFKTVESNPDLAAMHSNLGVLFMLEEKNEESEKSLNQALRLAQIQKDSASEAIIRYNLGVLFGQQKKVSEALEQYQAALEINPTSVMVKHNIELLIQNNSGSKSGDQQQKEKNKDGQGQENQENQDNNKENKDSEDEKEKKDQKQGYEPNAKYKPRPFQGEELSEGDVKKILGELKNQEQRIRANFEKKERKEKKNDKDW